MALTARDIMETQVITLSPNDPLSSVHRLFFEEEIHGAPVVDEQGRVLGIITTMDLLRAAADEHDTARGDPSYFHELFELSGPDWDDAPDGFIDRLREHTAAECMTEDVACVSTDAGVPEIARTLRQNRIHRVLVVEDGILRGIISTSDLVALLERGE
jgi:CBS domain-containing protein